MGSIPKSIGVLSSGGDAPGMNAAIRAVVRTAISAGCKVYGVQKGYHGLINDLVNEMDSHSVVDIIHRGGTILKTARSEEFQTESGFKQALSTIEKHKIDGLVVIGGDGSFRGAARLAQAGVPTIGVPATIDNDVNSTERAIGFDTAVNTVIDAINKIRDTATSHERTYVVEVMGRNSGFIALYAGVAGGADQILIPERPIELETVCEKVVLGQQRGRSRSIIVVAEGFHPAKLNSAWVPGNAGLSIGNYIGYKTGLDTRVTTLGHLQRGGNPTALDRILASRFGYRAAQLLISGVSGKVVGLEQNQIAVIDIEKALTCKKSIDDELYQMANVIAAI